MEAAIASRIKSWHPDRPASIGATAYHDAVANAPYYLESFDKLISIVSKKIKEGNVIVDFGAGTGVSAMQLMKSIKSNVKLWLVDNSPAWLGKAYEIFNRNSNVDFFLLEKHNNEYATLSETIGEEVADHVVSANTVHLIPNLEYTFRGINSALKPNGTFTFQSGNIIRQGREKGVLMIDDTVNRVHDIAIDTIRKNPKYKTYRETVNARVEAEKHQRKIIFPEPRPLQSYLDALKSAYFKHAESYSRLLKIKYNDWMNFLKVRRLQAGILPELGGVTPTPQEEKDRDTLITDSASQLFKELEVNNPMSDKESFIVELIYVTALKQ